MSPFFIRWCSQSTIATFRLQDEDHYEYEFSVLSTRCRFGGRKLSKCACSELKTRTRGRPRTPIWRSLISTQHYNVFTNSYLYALALLLTLPGLVCHESPFVLWNGCCSFSSNQIEPAFLPSSFESQLCQEWSSFQVQDLISSETPWWIGFPIQGSQKIKMHGRETFFCGTLNETHLDDWRGF